MNVEFNWWLLLVGLAGGAALTWLILADLSRREPSRPPGSDPDEVTWIAGVLDDEAAPTEPAVVERILELHRSWTADVDEAAHGTTASGAAAGAEPVDVVPGPDADEEAPQGDEAPPAPPDDPAAQTS